MKMPDTKVREHIGNIAEGRSAIFDEASIKYIFGYLTDLYSDRATAAIRELSTNAWDSHVEAGTKRPIEVTLPTSLSPTFVLRDYGVGLTPEGVYQSFGVYGHSTKRHSDDFNGMLGLGSKAAITYTDTFVVTAVRDGIRSESVITRGEDGVLSVTTPEGAISQTNEPNGVQVSIPVPAHDVSDFRRKARQFYSFWQPGTVLVDGAEPEGAEVLFELDPQVFLVADDDFTSRVIMGNVAYPLTYGATRQITEYVAKRTGLTITRELHAYVPTGAVNFTPSREALDYNAATEGTLRLIAEFVADAVVRHSESVIGDAPSLVDAYLAVQGLSKAIRGTRNTDRWNGQNIPGPSTAIGFASSVLRKTGASLDVNVTPQSAMGRNVFVTDSPVKRLAGKRRALVSAYRRATGADGVYLLDGSDISEWVEHPRSLASLVTWDELEEAAKESGHYTPPTRSSNPRKRAEEATYNVARDAYHRVYYRSSESHLPTREVTLEWLREQDVVAYVDANSHMETRINRSVFPLLSKYGITVVRIEGNRKDKFLRLLPEAVDLEEAVRGVLRPMAEQGFLTFKPEVPFLPEADPSQVLDPGFEEAAHAANMIVQTVVDDRERQADFNNLRVVLVCSGAPTVQDATDKMVQGLLTTVGTWAAKYPLLNRSGSTQDNVKYINAVHYFNEEWAESEEDAA